MTSVSFPDLPRYSKVCDSLTSHVALADGRTAHAHVHTHTHPPPCKAETPWKKVNGEIYATSIPKTWTDVAGLFSLDPVKVKAGRNPS